MEISGGMHGRAGDLRTASVSDPAAMKSQVTLTPSGGAIEATVANHGYQTGDTVVITGSIHPAWNGTYLITSVTSNAFSYTPAEMHQNPVADSSSAIRVVKPLDTSYYRYWQAQAPGRTRSPIRLVVTGDSYARLRAAGVDPFTSTDADIKPFADHYFRYQAWNDYNAFSHSSTSYKVRFQVIEEVAQGAGCSACAGGQGSFKFDYWVNSATNDVETQYNVWRFKTKEYLPDTTNADANSDGIIDAAQWDDNDYNVVYTNEVGQPMLKVFVDAVGTIGSPSDGQKWISANRYDDQGRLVWSAAPSAITGYDETKADLLNAVNGNFSYVLDTAGLITTTAYYVSTDTQATTTASGGVTGYYKSTSVRRGETGSDVLQHSQDYIKAVSGNLTFHPVNSETVYRNDNGTGAQTTTYAYTFHNGTVEPESVTVTYPAATALQNGSGSADLHVTYFDRLGRPTWTKDEAGFIQYRDYDGLTGQLKTYIEDVNTARDTNADGDDDEASGGQTFFGKPTGWSTPTGAGLHLTTSLVYDKLGRATKFTAPNGNITYTVYKDADHEVRVYPGWGSQGPTQVVRQYRPAPGSGELVYDEYLTTSATPTTSSGVPTGGETISAGNIESLAREFRNKAGQLIATDSYHTLGSETYTRPVSPVSGTDMPVDIGTKNTHFYRTEYGYNKRGLPDRVLGGSGTITRTVYDAMGRPTETWAGTDDQDGNALDGTVFWSPATATNAEFNLVKVAQTEYDNGGVGDSLPTKVTSYPGGSAAARVSRFYYDWRDRLVAVKLGDEGGTGESTSVNRQVYFTDLDNLGQAIATYQYDGDNVSISTTNPAKPSSSGLVAQSETKYDEQGRVHQQRKYSVTSGGTVSANSLRTDYWYDMRGNVIKVAAPGGLVYKYQYDGAGRMTKSFVSDGGGDIAPGVSGNWSDADDVASDNVLEQTEYLYDLARNAVLTTTRQRFHGETDTGDLTTSGIDDRASYAVTYYDDADRFIHHVNYGTNGGTPIIAVENAYAWSSAPIVNTAEYDEAGRVWFATDPNGVPTLYEYDLLGRTTRTVEAYSDDSPSPTNDRTTLYAYNANGQVTSVTAKLTTTAFQTTNYIYGVNTGTGAGGGSLINSNDLLLEVRYPIDDTGLPSTDVADQQRYKYNALGDRTSFTDQNGTIHEYVYDVLGRETDDKVTTLGTNVDGWARRRTTTYLPNGQVGSSVLYGSVSGTDWVTEVQWTYNGLGDQAEVQLGYNDGSSNVTGVGYVYDFSASGTANRSRLTTMQYASGRQVHYGYGAENSLDYKIGRVTFIADDNDSLGVGLHLEEYSYLGLNTIVERNRPTPGTKLTYLKQGSEGNGEAGDQYAGLDRFGRVRDQRWMKGTTELDRFVYTYDKNSNRTSKDVLGSGNPGNIDEVYVHDNLNRLMSVTRGTLSGSTISGTPTFSQSYTLDALGNWDSSTTNGTSQARTHNRKNELTAIGGTALSYDANGNLRIDETGKRFVYDAWNHLVKVDGNNDTDYADAVDATYRYNGLGYRVTQTTQTVTTEFSYDLNWRLIEEQVADEYYFPKQYVWGLGYVDALILRDRDADGNSGTTHAGTLGTGGEERLWFQQDANYNVTSVTDDTGTAQERYTYTPYGVATYLTGSWGSRSASAHNQLHLFQGLKLDPITGLLHARNRDYNPTHGRWSQPDPIGYGDGMNVYQAYGSGPATFVDPLGLDIWSGRGPKPEPGWADPQPVLDPIPLGPSLEHLMKLRELADDWQDNDWPWFPGLNECEEQALRSRRDITDAYENWASDRGGPLWDLHVTGGVSPTGFFRHNLLLLKPINGNQSPPHVLDPFHSFYQPSGLVKPSIECETNFKSRYPRPVDTPSWWERALKGIFWALQQPMT